MTWTTQYRSEVLPDLHPQPWTTTGFMSDPPAIVNGSLRLNNVDDASFLFYTRTENYIGDVSMRASMRAATYDLIPGANDPSPFVRMIRKGVGAKGCFIAIHFLNDTTVRSVIQDDNAGQTVQDHTVSSLGDGLHIVYLEYIDGTGAAGELKFYLDGVLLRTHTSAAWTTALDTTFSFGDPVATLGTPDVYFNTVFYSNTLNSPLPIDVPKIPSFLYNNVLNANTVFSSTPVADTGYSVAALGEEKTYTLWQPIPGSNIQFITIDELVSSTRDTLAIINHNLSTLGISVSVETSTDNFNTQVVVVLPPFIPTSDKIIYKEFPQTVTSRYWRLRLSAAANTVPYMAIMMIGERFTVERSLVGDFDIVNETVMSLSQQSMTGQLLGTAVSFTKKEVNADFVMSKIVYDSFKPVLDFHFMQKRPFVWVYDNVPYYLRLKDNFSLSVKALTPTLRKFNLSMEGITDI